MKYLKQFFIIILICIIGEVIKRLVPLPIPTSIYGLVILLLALQFKVLKISSVKEVSTLLIDIMPIMFIPAAAGVINIWDQLSPVFIKITIIVIVSTIVVMAVSGLVTQKVREFDEDRERK
jgi:lrgA family protein